MSVAGQLPTPPGQLVLQPDSKDGLTRVAGLSFPSPASLGCSLSASGTCYRLDGDPGTSTLCVLIHGIGSTMHHFQLLAATLSDAGYAVLRYDLLGRGASLLNHSSVTLLGILRQYSASP